MSNTTEHLRGIAEADVERLKQLVGALRMYSRYGGTLVSQADAAALAKALDALLAQLSDSLPRSQVAEMASIANAEWSERLARDQARIAELEAELKLWRSLVSEGGVPRYTVTPGAALNSVVTSTDALLRRALLKETPND